MIISKDISVKVREKRGREFMSKLDLAHKLGITTRTLTKIEKGDYKAPKRIYQAVMEWLVEDC